MKNNENSSTNMYNKVMELGKIFSPTHKHKASLSKGTKSMGKSIGKLGVMKKY